MLYTLLGAHEVDICIPSDYQGKCTVMSGEEILAALPSCEEAISVARYAVSPFGGYSFATVVPSPGGRITHTDLVEWIVGI